MTWACWCGSTDDLIVFQLDRDPETVPREPGEVVPAVLALCPAHRRTDDGGD